MNEHAILKEIKSGKIFPLYLFFGHEELLLKDTLNEAINLLIDSSSRDFNFNSYSAEDSSPAEVLDTIRTLPCMVERRVVVLKKVDAAKQSYIDNESFLNYLKSPFEETCLILTAREMDKRKKFFTIISKTGKTVHFPKLKSYQSVKWILRRTKAKGYQIESSAAEYMAEAFDNNLQRIENELEKIFLYSGDVKLISLDTVQLVAGNPKVDSIFALTDAIGAKNIDSSLGKIENLLSHGALPVQALGMITRQFRLIWETRVLTEKGTSSSQISGKIGVPPYFVGEIISQAKKFTLENLKYIFQRLLKTDIELKSSGRAPGLIMDSLVIDLCLS